MATIINGSGFEVETPTNLRDDGYELDPRSRPGADMLDLDSGIVAQSSQEERSLSLADAEKLQQFADQVAGDGAPPTEKGQSEVQLSREQANRIQEELAGLDQGALTQEGIAGVVEKHAPDLSEEQQEDLAAAIKGDIDKAQVEGPTVGPTNEAPSINLVQIIAQAIQNWAEERGVEFGTPPQSLETGQTTPSEPSADKEVHVSPERQQLENDYKAALGKLDQYLTNDEKSDTGGALSQKEGGELFAVTEEEGKSEIAKIEAYHRKMAEEATSQEFSAKHTAIADLAKQLDDGMAGSGDLSASDVTTQATALVEQIHALEAEEKARSNKIGELLKGAENDTEYSTALGTLKQMNENDLNRNEVGALMQVTEGEKQSEYAKIADHHEKMAAKATELGETELADKYKEVAAHARETDQKLADLDISGKELNTRTDELLGMIEKTEQLEQQKLQEANKAQEAAQEQGQSAEKSTGEVRGLAPEALRKDGLDSNKSAEEGLPDEVAPNPAVNTLVGPAAAAATAAAAGQGEGSKFAPGGGDSGNKKAEASTSEPAQTSQPDTQTKGSEQGSASMFAADPIAVAMGQGTAEAYNPVEGAESMVAETPTPDTGMPFVAADPMSVAMGQGTAEAYNPNPVGDSGSRSMVADNNDGPPPPPLPTNPEQQLANDGPPPPPLPTNPEQQLANGPPDADASQQVSGGRAGIGDMLKTFSDTMLGTDLNGTKAALASGGEGVEQPSQEVGASSGSHALDMSKVNDFLSGRANIGEMLDKLPRLGADEAAQTQAMLAQTDPQMDSGLNGRTEVTRAAPSLGA